MLQKCGATALACQQQKQVGMQEAEAFACCSSKLAADASSISSAAEASSSAPAAAAAAEGLVETLFPVVTAAA
jgi:hypothetical protein